MKPYVNPKQTLNKPKRVGPTKNLWASLGGTPGLGGNYVIILIHIHMHIWILHALQMRRYHMIV